MSCSCRVWTTSSILLDPTDDQSWEAVRDTLQEDIALTVHLTLTHRTLDSFDATLTGWSKWAWKPSPSALNHSI